MDGLSINPLTYEVDEIEAVEVGIWKATVRMALPETLDDVRVAHQVQATIRFKYPADGSAAGLLQAAHEKALATLSAASRATGQQSVEQLLTRSWIAARDHDPEDN